jgi:hypothetical protein
MSCPSCGSMNLAEFPTEIMIHLGGPAHPTDPGVMVFPKVLVCLNCGASRFSTPEAELQMLRERMRPATSLDTGDRGSRSELLSGQATADKSPAAKNCIDGGR